MFAGEIYAPGKIRLIDVPEPKLAARPAQGEGQIIFQPELGCLCGSDLLYFEADYPEYPPVIGHSLHEMIGTVVDTNGSRFARASAVVRARQSRRTVRTFLRQRAARFRSTRACDDHALLAQPLGTVLYALKKLPNLLDLDVVVVGQGPIGHLFDLARATWAAREIIAIDRIESRLKTSPKTGATRVINGAEQDPIEAVKEITGGAGADIVIEAVGHREQALSLCTDLCRKAGRILYFGVPTAVIDGVR